VLTGVFAIQNPAGRHLQVSAAPVRRTDGAAAARVLVFHDVTRLKAYETSRADFVANLTHELRTPLAAICGYAETLSQGVDDRATERRFISIIERQSRRLARLIDDLVSLSDLERGLSPLKFEAVEPRRVAEEAAELMREPARRNGIELEVRAAAELPPVSGDHDRMTQVMVNLLDNALKYTPRGGRVEIITERTGDQSVLHVRDSGIGMPTELVPRIFDLFTQAPQTLERSHGGLGLGLTLVKRLVELHGGSVAASSAGVGEGSEFTITLPAAAEPTGSPAGASVGARDRTRPAGRRVLVVEDSADARLGVQLLLEQAGHVVETACDGPDGLAKLGTFHPDVALIDVGLPGMDGYALARAARSQPETRDIRLIAITGYGQAEDRQRALDAGFDLHVAKPVDLVALQELLTTL
jgi:two-component system CheB/CheR fusion protein